MISFFLPEIRENKITCLLRMLLLFGIAMASILNLLVMSLERYAALTYPIWHLTMSKKWLMSSVVASWVVAMLLSALPLFGWNTWDEKVQCVSRWYDPIPTNCLTFLSSINALSLIVSSILFLKVVVTTYSALNQRFGKDGKLGTQPHSSITSKTSVEKTKLYVLMLGLFVVFWGPYCIVVVLKPVLPSHRKHLDEAEKYSSLLALSNSAFNWIIYGLKNRQIRNAFKVALCGCKNGNDTESRGSETNQYTQEESMSRSNTAIEINCVDVSPYLK
ncbi:OPN1LW [Mytilus edulis]|uniref:OPN1LW n=1 Tax=Mytilus edulis TaxID=6550 RepID=A0A8S3SEB2_MYTED|nr:OPN1LW [Mytilus edulis]